MSTKSIKYTRRAGNDGWLRILLTQAQWSGTGVNRKLSTTSYLCEYTGVEIKKQEGGKTYFTILDGAINVGQEAHISTQHADKYLVDAGPNESPALINVRYVGKPSEEVSPFKGRHLQQWGELTAPGVSTTKITLNSYIEQKYTPIPPGHHLILAPDGSHNISTEAYAEATSGMVGNDIWFPIGLNGAPVNSSRYIHVGHISDGCVTCHQLENWTAIYTYLIAHRIPGSMGQYVGHLEVTK